MGNISFHLNVSTVNSVCVEKHILVYNLLLHHKKRDFRTLCGCGLIRFDWQLPDNISNNPPPPDSDINLSESWLVYGSITFQLKPSQFKLVKEHRDKQKQRNNCSNFQAKHFVLIFTQFLIVRSWLRTSALMPFNLSFGCLDTLCSPTF